MNKRRSFYEKEIERLNNKRETIRLKKEYIKLKSEIEPNFFTLLGKFFKEMRKDE